MDDLPSSSTASAEIRGMKTYAWVRSNGTRYRFPGMVGPRLGPYPRTNPLTWVIRHLAYFVGDVAFLIPWSCSTETIEKPSSSGHRRAWMSGKESQESRTCDLSCPCRTAGVARRVCVHLTGRTSVHAM